MLTTNEVAQVFETILSSPGMNDAVRIDMRISRKNVLLINHIIERGLGKEGEEVSSGLFSSVSEEVKDELKDFISLCLEKAGLVELNQKLLQLNKLEKKS
ncbi:hypothetical protein [Flavobacterium beibuense]|uniref:hypothetical protein n=1 Tax=Flavobacterium beibuense TaxID=657326 RepID=UPI003A8D4748